MSATLLFSLVLAAPTQVRGLYLERFYTGACDREGVPAWEDRPAEGKHLFVRITGESPAPALAEFVSGPGGSYASSFTAPANGSYCVAHQGKERLVCLTSFETTTIEGSTWNRIVLGPVNPRPACVSQRRKVRGTTLFVEEPCADAGKPAHAAANKRFWIHDVSGHEPDVTIVSDAEGHFATALFPGRYCARIGARQRTLKEQAVDACVTTFDVTDRDMDDVAVPFTRTCGTSRAAVPGGTLHVRGRILHQTTYWGGAYRRDPPPVVEAGNVLRVRRGDTNGPEPVIAEVITDELGFDVALPPGTWCLETAYHDEWFKSSAKANPPDFDRACLKRSYMTCDRVVHLDATDIDDVVIKTTQWHPPSSPCRTRPYTGSSPP